MPDYERMTEEELERLLTEKYGEDWTVNELDPDDALTIAFMQSISTGKERHNGLQA